jgi:hypothetical protein
VDRSVAAARFRVALDLADTGVALMRQNLRRRHPGCTEQEIDALLQAWQARLPAAVGAVDRH